MGAIAAAIVELGFSEPALWQDHHNRCKMDVAIVDSAITSTYFWSYRAAFEVVADALEHAMHCRSMPLLLPKQRISKSSSLAVDSFLILGRFSPLLSDNDLLQINKIFWPLGLRLQILKSNWYWLFFLCFA